MSPSAVKATTYILDRILDRILACVFAYFLAVVAIIAWPAV